ncbi:MAG TPA: hypothetical protein VEY91_06405 [Candidatus Limnocylindria bacterium]|nr:hypothetical protein [Candidatus Limnocylindria bacterium]
MRKPIALALVMLAAVWVPITTAQTPPQQPEAPAESDASGESDEPIEISEELPPDEWTIEAFQGGAYSLPTKLTIRQLGFPPINVHARYAVRPHDFPLYYALRVARWRGDRAWGIELIHYKLLLREAPPEVQHFSASHGYNLVTLSHRRRIRGVIVGAAAGLVVAHPENRVRGRELMAGGIAGYHLAGPTGAVIAGFDYRFGERWFLAAEARFSGSYARVPVDDGHASMPDFGLHGHLGAGYRFGRR